MGKLIDSDELKARLKNLHLMAISGYGAEEVVAKVLEEMPEGIVRCKDCVYRSKTVCMLLSHGNTMCHIEDDDFCSMAERCDDGL